MKIYKMTATFGKLEHQTLTLEPGLNIITAPNEWGKSTWSAFLVAMLYGLDTRAKTTRATLADKERFAPWSGSPMEGRIDLNWNGRDITIERKTKRRVPLGDFRAYETESGIPVPELTAANCGQQLLGVEQTVFRRAGFIRHADLPVTQDEALRRRLNALVTTGDESGAADRLAAQLKDLRNRCRYNRTGLLPQAEGERETLVSRLGELEMLETQSQSLSARIRELEDQIRLLANHRQALEYTAFEEASARAEQAKNAMEAQQEKLRELEDLCADLPPQEEAIQQIYRLRQLREDYSALQAEQSRMPEEPEAPLAAVPFDGMTPEEARKMVKKDRESYVASARTGMPNLLIFMGTLGILAAGALLYLRSYPFGAVTAVAAVTALVWGIWERISLKKRIRFLREKYDNDDPARWADEIGIYERKLHRYHSEKMEFEEAVRSMQFRQTSIRERRATLCPEQEPEEMQEYWQQVARNWESCLAARQEEQRSRSHYETMCTLVKPAEMPAEADTLTYTEQETTRLLTENTLEQQRLQNRLGQCQGRMESLGDKRQLQNQLAQKHRRIARLEQTYQALTIAQDTLALAKEELQRRFAPRITKRAQEFLGKMTHGRYNMVTMGTDFSLQARAEQEDTLHDALWRSDGTVDQLYLALRLAVAEELTPEAPLILDDALVRFDDKRMRAAVDILREMAEHKQVILFTCQGREGTAS